MQQIADITSAFLTPLIAVITVYIAFQQYRTNLRRELRESRSAKLECYKKVALFINDTDSSGSVSPERHKMLGEALAEADFLFPENLTSWLDDIYSSATQWIDFDNHISRAVEEAGISRSEFKKMYSHQEGWKKQQEEMEECIEEIRNASFDYKERFNEYIRVI